MIKFAAMDVTKRTFASAVLLAGLLLLDGQLGPLTFPLRRATAASVAALVVAAVLCPRLSPRAVASLAALGVTAVAPTVALASLAYVLALALLVSSDDSHKAPVPWGLPAACLTYLGIGFCRELVPQLRIMDDWLSDAAHTYLRAATKTEHQLSPTSMGTPAAFLAASYLVWRWRRDGSRMRLVGAALAPAAWFATLPLAVLVTASGPRAVFLRGACHGFIFLGIAAIIDSATPRRLIAPRAGRNGSRLAAAGLSLASLIVGMTLVGPVPPWPAANRSIVVHNHGGLDWDRPVFGKFGAFSGGMFGLFPVYLRAEGYRFEVIDHDTIRPEDLSGFQTLVLINSPKQWAGDELRTLRGFVAQGGSLLVLGDHTDVFGLMKGFNTLLADFGVQFQFDSAYFARSTWRGCSWAACDAVASRWNSDSPGVAIGASLSLRGSARPLLVGRYAHSDIGVRSNVVGSFLGDYHYDQNERLGDTVLIASATHGRGRVVVFGDTSAGKAEARGMLASASP